MNESIGPLVSIIMPCFNQGQYVEEAIRSVLAQTYSHFEIIVVNDGSTDPFTVELLHRLDFPKTRVLHTTNQDLPAARNNGIRTCSGDYFLPLDADDKIGPDYVRQAVEIMRARTEVGAVFCHAEYFGMKRGSVPMRPFSVQELLVDCNVLCCALFRTEDWRRVGGYKPEMKHTLEDYEFWLSIVSLGREVVILPDCHFYYRIKSVSRAVSDTDDLYLAMRRKCYEYHRDLYLQHADELFPELFRLARTRDRPFWHSLAKTPIRPIGLWLLLQWHRLKELLRLTKAPCSSGPNGRNSGKEDTP